jgi:hypothetical protein
VLKKWRCGVAYGQLSKRENKLAMTDPTEACVSISWRRWGRSPESVRVKSEKLAAAPKAEEMTKKWNS